MNIALITAAGSGTRMQQDIPKQFITVYDKPVIMYTMEAFQKHPLIDEIYVICLKGWEDTLRAYAKQYNITKLKEIVLGGDTGQQSIINGLNEIKKTHKPTDLIMINDGNRPLINTDIISASVDVCKKHGNAIAAIPTTEAILVSEDGGVSSKQSVPREKLLRTQTPHTFPLGDLIKLYDAVIKKGINSVAACDAMAHLGKDVYFSPGSVHNFKLTTVEDFEMFKALLSGVNLVGFKNVEQGLIEVTLPTSKGIYNV